MKSIHSDQCDRHRQPFPAYGAFRGLDLPEHSKYLDRVMEQAKKKGTRVGYNSSWTISPKVREDKILRQTAFDVTAAFFYWHYQDKKVKDIFSAATLRFKVGEFKEKMGFQYLSNSSTGEKLCQFPCLSFAGEPIAMMHLNEYSEDLVNLTVRMKSLWEKRLVLAVERRTGSKQSEAA